jgi:hypothetical protein
MSMQNQVLRAPNERFYVLWRGSPVCWLSDVLCYFKNKQKAYEFLDQCEKQDRLIDCDMFAA